MMPDLASAFWICQAHLYLPTQICCTKSEMLLYLALFKGIYKLAANMFVSVAAVGVYTLPFSYQQ